MSPAHRQHAPARPAPRSLPPSRGRTGSAPAHGRSSSRPCGPASTRVSGGSAISRSTESRTWSAGPPPTASRNSVSPEKSSSPLTRNETPSSECPGHGIASTESPPVSSAPVTTAASKRRDDVVLACDVIRMRVRPQHVGHRQPVRLHGREQRLERRARVDEDCRAAGCVCDQVRVREPPGMHRALDDHCRNVPLGATLSARLAP